MEIFLRNKVTPSFSTSLLKRTSGENESKETDVFHQEFSSHGLKIAIDHNEENPPRGARGDGRQDRELRGM